MFPAVPSYHGQRSEASAVTTPARVRLGQVSGRVRHRFCALDMTMMPVFLPSPDEPCAWIATRFLRVRLPLQTRPADPPASERNLWVILWPNFVVAPYAPF